MAKFIVHETMTTTYVHEVEAKDEAEAYAKVCNGIAGDASVVDSFEVGDTEVEVQGREV